MPTHTHDPASELVDVIGAEGRVVAVATRAEIRAHRLLHRCTYVLVFNSAGGILIHRRTDTKDVFPGCWDVTVGGVVAAGENWDAGARREVLEEIGVSVEPRFLFDYRYDGPHASAFGRVFSASHDGPFRLQPEEVVEAGFVAPSLLPELFSERPFCPDGVAVWHEFTRRKNFDRQLR